MNVVTKDWLRGQLLVAFQNPVKAQQFIEEKSKKQVASCINIVH